MKGRTVHNMSKFELECEQLAFMIATESLGLTTYELADILNGGAQMPVPEREVFKVLEGSSPVPSVWWVRLRVYEERVRQRKSVLAMNAARTGFQNITSGVFAFDLDSAFDRDAAGRAIRSLSSRSRAFVVQRS